MVNAKFSRTVLESRVFRDALSNTADSSCTTVRKISNSARSLNDRPDNFSNVKVLSSLIRLRLSQGMIESSTTFASTSISADLFIVAGVTPVDSMITDLFMISGTIPDDST